MGIQTKTVISCDQCEKEIVADEATTTGYLNIENACPQKPNGEWATELPPAIPTTMTFCNLDCLKEWTNK